MCGRYIIRRIEWRRFSLTQFPESHFEEFSEHPHFNVAPSQLMPIIGTDQQGVRAAKLARWGLVPHWVKGKPKSQPINARSETVATSPMFRSAFERRRCLIPADGFYEWQGAKP